MVRTPCGRLQVVGERARQLGQQRVQGSEAVSGHRVHQTLEVSVSVPVEANLLSALLGAERLQRARCGRSCSLALCAGLGTRLLAREPEPPAAAAERLERRALSRSSKCSISMLLLRDIVLPGKRSFLLFLSCSLIAGVRYCHQRERLTPRSPRRAFTGRIICINTKAPGVYSAKRAIERKYSGK